MRLGDINAIREFAQGLAPELIWLRRELHKNPELACSEFETAKLVAQKLEAIGLPVSTQKDNCGVVAIIEGAFPGKTVALRADMDALPIREQNNVPYCSNYDGIMHACGHDAHTAALLGAAKILVNHKNLIHGRVKLIFQPGEEIGFGANAMIQEGVLDSPKVDAIFALHVDPLLKTGEVGYRAGAICSTGGGFELKVIGKGGHGAAPHYAIDPIPVAAELILALQTIASSKLDPLEPFVLTIGTIHGGTKGNILPDTVTLTGTMRALRQDVIVMAGEQIERLAEHITAAHGASYTLELRVGNGPLVNDAAMTAIVVDAAKDLLDANNVIEVSPSLVGEDFSLYAQRVPAAFVFLGVGREGAENYALHHPQFDIDESALPIGSALLAQTAIRFLGQ